MSVIDRAAEVFDQSELAYIADVLERIRPVPRPRGLIGQWVPDPSDHQQVICVWVQFLRRT
jgi:hypothetical protein